MQRPWTYLINPFIIATEGTYVKFLIISTYHLNKLKSKAGDPFIDGLIKYYEPLHDAFVSQYNKWKAAGGIGQGGTQAEDEMITQLSGDKAYEWDLGIQMVYKDKTAQYKALLPHHRQVFQSGPHLDRINAVKALSDAIGADASLTTVKASVDAFYKALLQVSTTKDVKHGAIGAGSEAVETARVNGCTGQYANLGKCIAQYAATPEDAGFFFDQSTIRHAAQVTFTHHIKPQSIYNITRRTLQAGQSIVLHNTGSVSLVFYAAAQQDNAPATKYFDIAAGDIKTVTAAEFGNNKENPFINVENKATTDGSFDMDIK